MWRIKFLCQSKATEVVSVKLLSIHFVTFFYAYFKASLLATAVILFLSFSEIYIKGLTELLSNICQCLALRSTNCLLTLFYSVFIDFYNFGAFLKMKSALASRYYNSRLAVSTFDCFSSKTQILTSIYSMRRSLIPEDLFRGILKSIIDLLDGGSYALETRRGGMLISLQIYEKT